MIEIVVQQLIDQKKLVVNDGYRAKNSELEKEGIPFARAGNINNGFLFDDADRFPLENLDKVGNKISEPGDVVFTSKGTVGRFAFVQNNTPKFVYSPQLCFWRSTDQNYIDPFYLYYWMSSREFVNQINSVKGQTDMADYVSLTEQRKMIVRIPDISIQREIGKRLSALDQKIQLNRQISDTLESMAKAIFKEWFIDFGPVKAKAEGKIPFGMDDETASLFPSSFEEASLEIIPKGWGHSNVDSATDLIIDHRGKTPLKLGGEWSNSGYQAISAKNIKANRLVNLEQRYVDESLYKKWMKDPIVSGDILMTSEAPMGEMYFVTTETDFVLSQRVYGIRAKNTFTSEFLYFWLDCESARSDMEGRSTGTTVTGIRQSELRRVSVLQPSIDIQKAFSKLALPMLIQVSQYQREIKLLTQTRDLLLPKFISGEIELKESK